jgi:predicted glutamine amidotransferase
MVQGWMAVVARLGWGFVGSVAHRSDAQRFKPRRGVSKAGQGDFNCMCRLAAYLGTPIYLDELIAKPHHSLVHQSLRAEEGVMQTHGDGCGVGWYGERTQPGVYRDVTPAWGDENLAALAQTLRSRILFAHVRAATAGTITRQNSHPFRHGPYLFMHNGQVGGYGLLRRTLEARLPDDLFEQRKGSTDSELLFLLALARMRTGAAPDLAMLAVLDETLALMRLRGVKQPLRFAAVLSDGERLYAFRIASDAEPPTLYLRQQDQGTWLASEPLFATEAEAGSATGPARASSRWRLLPAGAVVCVDPGSAGLQERLHPTPDSNPGADRPLRQAVVMG